MDAPLHKTLADAVILLAQEQLPYALIGGLAASLRGQPRVTADVDLLIIADVDRVLEFAASLPSTNFRPLFADPSEVVRRSFILPLQHRSTDIKVDLAVGLTGFERQTVEQAEQLDVAGTRVAVARAEDLLLLKVLAGRPQDDQDVQGIVAAQGERLDWHYCLATARELEEAIGVDVVRPVEALRNETTFDD